MSREALHSQLVIKKHKLDLSQSSKIFSGLSLLVVGFMLGILLASHFSIGKKRVLKQGYIPMTRLPVAMDRVVLDASAYVYVKHASLRVELNIPWDEWIKN